MDAKPISTLHWDAQLRQLLVSLTKPDRSLTVAIVGVGHELRGDDAAGPAVAGCLQKRYQASSRVLVVNAGSAPENCIGPLRRFSPDLILFVDAVQIDQPPGSICILSAEVMEGAAASTHALPLSMLATYLKSEMDCEVALVGIQAADNSLGHLLTRPVTDAIQRVVQTLAAAIGSKKE